jgi:hypothetical protein
MWLIALALVGVFYAVLAVVNTVGPTVVNKVGEWTEPIHERAFRIAAASGEAKDANREAAAAAKGYLQAGDAAKYREWKEKEEYWGGR